MRHDLFDCFNTKLPLVYSKEAKRREFWFNRKLFTLNIRNPDIREIMNTFSTNHSKRQTQVDDRISNLETKIDLMDGKLDRLIYKLDS